VTELCRSNYGSDAFTYKHRAKTRKIRVVKFINQYSYKSIYIRDSGILAGETVYSDACHGAVCTDQGIVYYDNQCTTVMVTPWPTMTIPPCFYNGRFYHEGRLLLAILLGRTY